MNMVYDKRDAFPISAHCMPHLGSNISSDIYNASIGSEAMRFAGNTSESNTFVTFANQLLKRMQKENSKHRFVISKLIKNNFSTFNFLDFFLIFFADTADNFIALFFIPLSWGFLYKFLLLV